MWLFTRYGFYSVVRARPDPQGGLAFHQSPERVMVRARIRRQLVNLQQRFPSLSEFRIYQSRFRDYAYRIIIPKSVWVQIATELAADIDYSNFKDECAANKELEPLYVEALHDVWCTTYQLQCSER